MQDGGAIFGIVPRPRWSALHPPDPANRISLALRCLLIEAPSELVLVDTGIGSKPDPKFRGAHAVANSAEAGSSGRDRLESAIHSLGFTLSDVTIVINTHLHFDHAGGNTVEIEGEVGPAFPAARYVVQRGEWEDAHLRNERSAGAYRPKDFRVLGERRRLTLVDGRFEPLPGLSVFPTPGHTPHHQSLLITGSSGSVCFTGDLLPTISHLPPAWTMAFDVEPLRTMETKRDLLRRAADEEWIVITPHDPRHSAGWMVRDGGRVVHQPI